MATSRESPNHLLEAALSYAAQGIPVFPVKPKQKVPLVNHWGQCSTTKEKRIREWWRKSPKANIGIPTGSASGFWALDIDQPDGPASLETLEAQNGRLPSTVKLMTGGGGVQYVWQWGGIEVRNSAKRLGPGLDVRGEGGYIVVPPSIHPSGSPYRGEIVLDQIAPSPEWLLSLAMSANSERTQKASDLGRIPEGRRNDSLASIGGKLRRIGLTEPGIRVALLAENEARCFPPLPESEVAGIAKSICTYPVGGPEGNTDGPWGDPISLEPHGPLPSFPTEALPEWLKAWVDAEAEATQTPSDLAAFAAVSVIATAVQRFARIEMKPGYFESLNLYAVVSLPPGTRKSAVVRHAMKPALEYERENLERAEPLVSYAKHNLDVLDEKLKKAKKAAGDGKGEQSILSKCIKDFEEAKKYMPIAPRLFASDATIEKIVMIQSEQNGCLSIISSESEIFATLAGRYTKNGSVNMEPILKAYSEDTIQSDRISRSSEHIESPRLTIFSTVQPSVLEGFSTQPEFSGRGLLGRFMYAVPVSPLGSRNHEAPPMPEATAASYDRHIRALLELWREDGQEMHMLGVDADAFRTFRAFEDAVEPMLANGGDLSHMTDWGGKIVGRVARIAGLLHLAEFTAADGAWPRNVTAETMANAVSIGRYLIEHAKAAYGQMGANPQREAAAYLWQRILAMGGQEIENQALWQAVKGRFRGGKTGMDAALRVLEDHNLVRLAWEDRQGAGRPKGAKVLVNPRAKNSRDSRD